MKAELRMGGLVQFFLSVMAGPLFLKEVFLMDMEQADRLKSTAPFTIFLLRTLPGPALLRLVNTDTIILALKKIPALTHC